MQPSVSIEPVDASLADEFFRHLEDHVADNGLGSTPLFQPLPRSEALLSEERRQSFTQGMSLPLGAEGWRRAWVARGPDRRILGHVSVTSHPEHGSEHRCQLGMGVHRDHRRRGLGTALLAHALRWAGERTELEWVDLRVLSSNQTAIALYAKAGFAVLGEIPDRFRIDGQRLSDTLMAKRIRGST